MDTLSHSVKKLNFRTLLSIYLRSFFFQGSFSIKDRQNIGFAFCMEPVGRKLWTDQSDRKAFQLRHTEFFNGNPFMITLVLGAVANMEERMLNGKNMNAEEISRFKAATGQACGSVGDRFFWRMLRPFGLVLGLLWTMFYGLWGVLLFLAVFNIPTMFLRWYWLTAGYRLGPRVVIEIKNSALDRASRLMESLGGLIIAFFSVAFLSGHGYGISWISAGTVGLFVLSVILFKRGISHSAVLPIAACVALILGLILL